MDMLGMKIHLKINNITDNPNRSKKHYYGDWEINVKIG